MEATNRAKAQPRPDDSDHQKTRKGDTSARALVRLTEQLKVELFHTPAQEAFARICVRGHSENHRVKGSAFKDWLSAMCYHLERFVPGQNALAEAINALAGQAVYDGTEMQVQTRLAEHNGFVYLDLGSGSWEVVRISAEGWEVVPEAPVRFVRSPEMLALPHPLDGGRIDALSPLLNLSEDNLTLGIAWLIGAFRPKGPFTILVIEGTHGSAKTTAARSLIALMDPRKPELRAPPSNLRDLAISAENSWCLGFDNISHVKPWFSDALCRLSTGSGFTTRALYKDDEEKIFAGVRPVLLNGIAIGIDREDLRDRCIFLSLPSIPDEKRQTEQQVSARFREIQPFALGCLLDAVAGGLRRLPETKLDDLPRMADFTAWVCAAEKSLSWPDRAFCEAYSRNRKDSNALALEGSPLFLPITLLADKGPWEGTATELMDIVAKGTLGPHPETPKELSHALRRLTPNLLQIGYSVEFEQTQGNNSKRVIRISKVTSNGKGLAPEGSTAT
jgi:hypothetical protein